MKLQLLCTCLAFALASHVSFAGTSDGVLSNDEVQNVKGQAELVSGDSDSTLTISGDAAKALFLGLQPDAYSDGGVAQSRRGNDLLCITDLKDYRCIMVITKAGDVRAPFAK